MSVAAVPVKEVQCAPDGWVRVKEEPELKRERGTEEADGQTECATVKEELSGQMECVTVKEELSVQTKCVRVKEEAGGQTECIQVKKERETQEEDEGECGVSAAAARVGLYAGHGVKGELMLGPEQIQPPDSAYMPTVAPKNVEHISACQFKQTPTTKVWIQSNQAQLQFRPCSLKLKQKPADMEQQMQSQSSDSDYAKVTSQDVQNVLVKKESSPSISLPGEVSTKQHQTSCDLSKKRKSYKCEICFEIFSLKRNLACHKVLHTGRKLYKCDVCLKQFSKKRYLVRHIQMYNREEPCKCDICLKQFHHKADLVGHKVLHLGEKPYKCDICLKRFSVKRYLVRHGQAHHGEKPYKCDICLKQFPEKAQLVRHVQTHNGEKPYKCDICLRQFFRIGTLN